MSRSRAWRVLRTRSTRPLTRGVSLRRGALIATPLALERARPVWPSDSQLEEWKALEFRQLKPPSGEDLNQ